MATLKIRYPVHTLDNRQLFPADTIISAETLEALISVNHGILPQTFIMLKYGSIKDDILHFFNQTPYSNIFGDQRRIVTLLNLMESARLILPVLKSLDFFKQHDFYTYRHILMVFALSTLLAQDLVDDYQDLIQEIVAGPTHDFGKICIPLKILKKTKPLTLRERHIMEHHSAAGYVLLSYYLQDAQHLAAKVARDHHERKDGSGYPIGIRLMDRLVEIVVVSDIYDALISQRPYRPNSYDNRTALEEITEMAEMSKLNWEVVQALVACNRDSKLHYSECKVSVEKRGTPPPDNVYGVIVDEDTYSLNAQNQL